MRIFWLRFSVFCFLWVFMIVQYSENATVSLLFFTSALGLYFFLSIRKASFLLYICLTVIIVIHDLLIMYNTIYTFLLLLFVTIVSAFQLKEKGFMIYLISNLVSSLLLSILDKSRMIETLVISVFFYFIVWTLNRMATARNEQKAIYDELLGEYRRLKRMNLVAENNARLEERTKIARDIHDSVGHRLTALIMKLEMLTIQNTDTKYDELKQLAKDSLEETRHAVKALQTEENEGIATVVHLIRKLEAESHILVQFTMKQGILSIALSNEKSVVLYRVIQEALTNAMRHAGSREVHITLGKSAIGAVSFEIVNPIFTVKSIEFGFGLTNMMQRVEEIGGDLEVFQTDNQFVVSGTIPSD
ncbi:sensor histidine kinase [Virgibacillus oceani]|uniref:histidine kinase n=1 Tax=Virgibacillus oceani TaxID=1479511 RepID=A0A917HPT3_9BACI|nr:sensor histidine kinase [Virgibacillus oceani]GGG86507.1 histidine kinase [Virgibacillus oceani]